MPEPAAASTAVRLRSACSAWAATPSASSPLPGSAPTWPGREDQAAAADRLAVGTDGGRRVRPSAPRCARSWVLRSSSLMGSIASRSIGAAGCAARAARLARPRRRWRRRARDHRSARKTVGPLPVSAGRRPRRRPGEDRSSSSGRSRRAGGEQVVVPGRRSRDQSLGRSSAKTAAVDRPNGATAQDDLRAPAGPSHGSTRSPMPVTSPAQPAPRRTGRRRRWRRARAARRQWAARRRRTSGGPGARPRRRRMSRRPAPRRPESASRAPGRRSCRLGAQPGDQPAPGEVRGVERDSASARLDAQSRARRAVSSSRSASSSRTKTLASS